MTVHRFYTSGRGYVIERCGPRCDGYRHGTTVYAVAAVDQQGAEEQWDTVADMGPRVEVEQVYWAPVHCIPNHIRALAPQADLRGYVVIFREVEACQAATS